jgi:hypothetical protein
MLTFWGAWGGSGMSASAVRAMMATDCWLAGALSRCRPPEILSGRLNLLDSMFNHLLPAVR